jgi:dipeptidyl aminopeptidase/acylaminoacyl peptidase
MKNIIVVLLVGLAFSLNAQKKMTPEMMWSLGRVSIDDVSQNGDSILYGVKYYNIDENKGIRNLYLLVNKDGKKDVTQLTDAKSSIGNGLLLPGGKFGYLEGGMWYVMVYGYSEAVKKSKVEGGISILKYSSDYSRVLYTKDVKVRKLIAEDYPQYTEANVLSFDQLMYMHWDHFEDDMASHIFWADVNADLSFKEGVDIMKGEVFDSPMQPFGGGEELTWNTDASAIAYTSKKMEGLEYATSTNSDIYLYTVSSMETSNLTQGMMSYDKAPTYSPDGKYVAWLSQEEEGNEADKTNIIIRDLTKGKQLVLTKNYPETVSSFTFSQDSKAVYFISPTKATYQYFAITLPKKVKPSGKVFYKPITTGNHNYKSLFQRADVLIGSRQDMNHSNEIYQVGLANGKQEKLSSVNDKLYSVIQKSKIEKRWIKTSDKKEMLTWIIYPPDFDPSKKYPAILYCQGGPQSPVSQFYSFRWNFQVMAAKGYVVIAPNRRGLPSFGEDWNDDISQDWGGQPIKDYLSALDSMVQEPFIDAERVGAVGASYGGFSVFYLAGVHEGRFKTFISHDGVFDFESMYGSTEELFFANHEFGGAPWDNPKPKSYKKFSPSNNADKWDTPILIIHGLKDYRVPFGQSQQAFQVAQTKGIPSKLLIFPDENHWVLKPQNSLIWHNEFYLWLDKWLK